jgi:peroxiredoxin
MLSESSTLKIGDTAPQFELPAANAMSVSLGQYLALGPLVIEFLRGTW